jgi:hypothetical protein
MSRTASKGISELPIDLVNVLALRSVAKENVTVKAKLGTIKFFSKPVVTKAIVPEIATGSGLSFRKTTDTSMMSWRTKEIEKSDDGFETFSGGRRKHNRKFEGGGDKLIPSGGAGFGGGSSYSSHSSHISHSYSSKPSFSSDGFHVKSGIEKLKIEKKVEESVEETIMNKIRAKINKLSKSTYEDTKESLQIILDGDETHFLSDFIKEVFNRAAKDTLFCGLYAKLLHELAYEHLRKEMRSIFDNYAKVFDEVGKSPDVGTEDYMKFIEAQEAKRHRKGYSQFISELVKLGEIESPSFINIVVTIVKSIDEIRKTASEENKVLCEEYADCLKILCNVGCNILKEETSVIPESVAMLKSIIRKGAEAERPGMSKKAQFAIQDVTDLADRGWKPKA